MDVESLFEHAEVAIVASDPDFKINYINRKGQAVFKDLFNLDKVVGRKMSECHKPETMIKLKGLYQDFKDKRKTLHYYVTDVPGGKATIVNIPTYLQGEFGGVIEFVFMGTLG